MLAKYICLLFSAILLVQCSNGKCLTASKVSDDSTASISIQTNSTEFSSTEQTDARNGLYKFEFGKNSDIIACSLEAYQKLLRDVIAEASKIENRSDKITEKLEECSKLAEKLEALSQNYEKLSNWEKITQIFVALVELGTLMNKYHLEMFINFQ